MNDSRHKSIAFNVRLMPVDHSNLPHSANYSHVGLAQGIAYLDFSFIGPALLGAIMQTAKEGQPAPKAIEGQLVTRVAMGVDVSHDCISRFSGYWWGCETRAAKS